jgi:hypothetical protein
MTTARNAFIAACGQPTGALPLVTRTRAPGPIGWLADVMYVPSSENRSHGSSLGATLRGLSNVTRFRYVFG